MNAQELASGELLLELVDAANRGLQAPLVGDEPDVVAVRLREADLGPVEQDHALAAEADDAGRSGHQVLSGVALDGVAVFESEDRQRPDGLVAEEDRAQRDPAGLAAEPGHDLRRADPPAVETSLLRGMAGEAPEVDSRMPPHRGVEGRHPRGDAEEEAGLLVGDDDLAAGVQGGEALSGPRTGLGEGRGQLGAAVAGALAQDRARAADGLGQPLGCLRRKVGAPGRDVEDRHGIAGHRRPERPRRHRPTRRSPCTSARVRGSAPLRGPRAPCPSRSSPSPTPTSTTTAPCCSPARGAASPYRPGRSGCDPRRR